MPPHAVTRVLHRAGPPAAAAASLILLAAWLVPQRLDWNRYRTGIAAIASARLGRPVTLHGDVALQLLPNPALEADHVTLADQGDGVSATIGALRLRVALWPLLWGRLRPQVLELDDPIVSLPWPLPRGTAPAPGRVPQSFAARLEGGTLHIAGFTASGLTGSLQWDPGSGALAAYGNVTLAGLHWRLSARIGSPGPAGASPLDIALDGTGAVAGTAGGLRGQLLANGTIEADAAAEGRNLATLLPVPRAAWQADGVLRLTPAALKAPRLAFSLNGVPGDATLALAFAPLRATATLHMARATPAGWAGPLLALRPSLPTHLAWAVDEAPLSGLALHNLSGTADFGADFPRFTATASLGPRAALTLQGQGRGESAAAGTLHLATSAGATLPGFLAATAPAIAAALPPAWSAAMLEASFSAAPASLALSQLRGQLGTTTLTGEASLTPGPRPALQARLALGAVTLPASALSLPAHALALATASGATADVTLHLSAQSLALGALTLGAPALEAQLTAGGLAITHAAATLPGGAVTLSGALARDGAVSALHASLSAAEAAALPNPAYLPALLWHGPLSIEATAAGPATAITSTAALQLEDLHATAALTLDAAQPRLTGALTLRHLNAARLLSSATGLPDTAWLGQGSAAAATHLTLTPASLALPDATLDAADIHLAGGLTLTTTGPAPTLTGTLHAANLIAPPPALLNALTLPSPLQAEIGFSATTLWATPHLAATGLSTTLTLAGGTLTARAIHATLAGGEANGAFAWQTQDHHWSATASLTGASLAGLAPPGLAFTAGTLDAQANLAGTPAPSGAIRGALHGAMLTPAPPAPAPPVQGPRAKRRAAPPPLGPLSGPVSLSVTPGAISLTAAQFATPRGTVSLAASWPLPSGTPSLQAGLVPPRKSRH